MDRLLLLPPLLPRRRRLAVDQDEGDPARLAGIVDPGMIGALLDQYVPSLAVDLGVIEQHVDLAFEDDGIVDGAGAMRVLVPPVALRRRIDAHVAQDLVMVM